MAKSDFLETSVSTCFSSQEQWNSIYGMRPDGIQHSESGAWWDISGDPSDPVEANAAESQCYLPTSASSYSEQRRRVLTHL